MKIPNIGFSILGDKHQNVRAKRRLHGVILLILVELHSVTQSGLIDMVIMLHTER